MPTSGAIAVSVFAVLLFWFWRRTSRATARAIALSKYAKQLSLDQAKYVHDLAVTGFGKYAAPSTDPMKDIEIATALRDRVDELEGRPAGPVHKVALRSALSVAVAKGSEPFRYGIQPSREDEERWGDHYTMMGRVYLYLDQAPPLPERE